MFYNRNNTQINLLHTRPLLNCPIWTMYFLNKIQQNILWHRSMIKERQYIKPYIHEWIYSEMLLCFSIFWLWIVFLNQTTYFFVYFNRVFLYKHIKFYSTKPILLFIIAPCMFHLCKSLIKSNFRI